MNCYRPTCKIQYFIEYEKEKGIPARTIWKTIDHFGALGAWPKLEIGEINDVEFGEIFSKECSEVVSYLQKPTVL